MIIPMSEYSLFINLLSVRNQFIKVSPHTPYRLSVIVLQGYDSAYKTHVEIPNNFAMKETYEKITTRRTRISTPAPSLFITKNRIY